MDVTVFLGAPGSGKGTQAKRLAETHTFIHLSTGDMLRSAIAARTPVGLEAQGFMDRGELVPDAIMIKLIEATFQGFGKESKRVLLDGFPRTVPQAQALDANPLTRVSRALCLEVPEDLLVMRLTGRRVCEKCGEPYHMVSRKPAKEGVCDKCGGKLMQRADDQESVVRRRLQVFHSQNQQLLDYFTGRKILHCFNGNQAVENLQAELLRTLG